MTQRAFPQWCAVALCAAAGSCAPAENGKLPGKRAPTTAPDPGSPPAPEKADPASEPSGENVNAPQATPRPLLENLGGLCRSRSVWGGRFFTDPPTGKSLAAFVDMDEISGLQLLLLDPSSGQQQSFGSRQGSGAKGLEILPSGKILLGTFPEAKILLFDLVTRSFSKTLSAPGEQYVFGFTRAGDGRYYGGTYPGARLVAFDPKGESLEVFAPPPSLDEGNFYLENLSPLPDGRLLCIYGRTRRQNAIFDPATKRFSLPPEALGSAFIAAPGITWNGKFLSGRNAWGGAAMTPVALPFPQPGEEWFSTLPSLTTSDTLVVRAGSLKGVRASNYLFRQGSTVLENHSKVDIPGVEYRSLHSDGRILAVRGQSWLVVHPGDTAAKLRPFTEAPSRRPIFLKVDAMNRLWGGPELGQTLFWYDLATSHHENTDQVVDGGGEVYDIVGVGKDIIGFSYSGGDIVRYDPTEPWNQIENRNPRTIATVGPDYIRPFGRAVLGDDGLVYAGWWAKYGTRGGAISITDPLSGATTLIKNPLGEHGISTIDVAGRFLLAGNALGDSGGPFPSDDPTPTTFGVVDLKSRTLVFSRDFSTETKRVLKVEHDKETGLAVVAVGGKLKRFSLSKMDFVDDLPPGIPYPTSTTTFVGDDKGHIYYGHERKLLRLAITTGELATVAELPGPLERLAIGSEDTLLTSVGSDIFRVDISQKTDSPR